MRPVAITIVAFALTVPLSAQWLTEPTRGVPRTADGKPNLAAPIFLNGGLRLEFIRDGRGVATHLLDGHVSGDYKFERTK